MRVPFETCNAMLAHDGGRGITLWQLAVEYESLRGQLREDEVIAMMTEIVRILRRSIAAGIAGTSYEDRILPAQASAFERRMAAAGLLDAGGAEPDRPGGNCAHGREKFDGCNHRHAGGWGLRSFARVGDCHG